MVKNPPANAGDARDMGLVPGLGRSPGEGNGYPLWYSGLENSMLSQRVRHDLMTWASLVAQMVKNQLAIQETWVQSLGWEDSLEEGMATHSSVLVWRILMDEEAWWATIHGAAKSQTRLSD